MALRIKSDRQKSEIGRIWIRSSLPPATKRLQSVLGTCDPEQYVGWIYLGEQRTEADLQSTVRRITDILDAIRALDLPENSIAIQKLEPSPAYTSLCTTDSLKALKKHKSSVGVPATDSDTDADSGDVTTSDLFVGEPDHDVFSEFALSKFPIKDGAIGRIDLSKSERKRLIKLLAIKPRDLDDIVQAVEELPVDRVGSVIAEILDRELPDLLKRKHSPSGPVMTVTAPKPLDVDPEKPTLNDLISSTPYQLFGAISASAAALSIEEKLDSPLELATLPLPLIESELKLSSVDALAVRNAASFALTGAVGLSAAGKLATSGFSPKDVAGMTETNATQTIAAANRTSASSTTQTYSPTATRAALDAVQLVDEALDVIRDLRQNITIQVSPRVRFPAQRRTQSRPLPRGAVVRIVRWPKPADVPAFKDTPAKSKKQADLSSDVMDKALSLANDANDSSLVRKLKLTQSGRLQQFEKFSEESRVIVESVSMGQGRFRLDVPVSELTNAGAATDWYLEIEYQGTVDQRSVRLDFDDGPHVIALRGGRSRIWASFFNLGFLYLIWEGADCIDCSTLPDDVEAAAGSLTSWLENFYELYGTSWQPETDHPAYMPGQTFTYQDEGALGAQLLTELEIGGSEYNRLITIIQPLYDRCGFPLHLDNTNDIPGHAYVWAMFGMRDNAHRWRLDPTFTIHFRGHYLGRDWNFTQELQAEDTPRTSDFSSPFYDFGQWDLPIENDNRDGMFRLINHFRYKLRQNIPVFDAAIQSDVDIQFDADELHPFVLTGSISYEDCNIWGSCTTRTQDFDFDLKYAIGGLHETNRVIPHLDASSRPLDYCYLRYAVLNSLDHIRRANEALGLEQHDIALHHYQEAHQQLNSVITDLDTLFDRIPRSAGEPYLHRAMTIGDVFAPVDITEDDGSLDEVFGRLAILVLLAAFSGGDEEVVDRMQRMDSDDFELILDGRIPGRPIHDVFHYLRDFVVPAGKAEVYLNRAGNASRADYDNALLQYEKAADYLPEDNTDTTASHFLWLRIARTFLLKGIALYNAGQTEDAYTNLGYVLCDSYGRNGRITVSPLRMDSGELQHNPLVLSLRIEACDYRANIDAGVNPLGYPEGYIPSVRWSWIVNQARAAAQSVNAAETRYINFRVNAENAQQRLIQLAGVVAEAEAARTAAVADTVTRVAQLDMAALQAGVSHNREARAQGAYNQFTRLSTIRTLYNGFSLITAGVLSVVTSSPAGVVGTGMSMVNTYSNDVFQRGQLLRAWREAQDGVRVGEQGEVVANRSLESARAYERLARLKVQIAQEALNFEQNREFNYARWYILADEMRDVVRRRLNHGLHLVFLAQQAFYYMTGINAGVIDYGYDPEDTAENLNNNYPNVAALESHLMGEHLLDAIAALEAEWLNFYNDPDYQGAENASSITESIRLDQQGSAIYTVDPIRFLQFREDGGEIPFEIRLDQLDCRREGTYHRLIEDVEIFGLVGSIGSQLEISGELRNSPFSIARVRDPEDRVIDTVTDDWLDFSTAPNSPFKTIIKPQPLQTLEFSGTLNPDSNFQMTATSATPILRPFEYNALAQQWVLEIKPSENPTLDFSQFITLGVRFLYSLQKDNGLRQLHETQCPTRMFGSVIVLQLFDNFFNVGTPPLSADDRYVDIQLLEDDFEPNHRNNPTLINVGLAFLADPGMTLPAVTAYLSSSRYVDGQGDPVEIAFTTTPDVLPNGGEVQMIYTDAGDPSFTTPLDALIDQDLTDTMVDPFLVLLDATGGASIRLRVNLAENPTFNLAQLDKVLMHLEYIYDPP